MHQWLSFRKLVDQITLCKVIYSRYIRSSSCVDIPGVTFDCMKSFIGCKHTIEKLNLNHYQSIKN